MNDYEKVRKMLLTNYNTGKLIRHPWFLAGCSSIEKEELINLAIGQVYMVKAMYEEKGTVICSFKRAVSLVKSKLYYTAKSFCRLMDAYDFDKRYELIAHIFNVQLGLEESHFTKRMTRVSHCLVANYDEADLFKKFKKVGDDWYAYQNTTKVSFVTPERNQYLSNSSSNDRFDVISNLIGSGDNEFITDCLLLDHLVDTYEVFGHPYQELMLGLNNADTAPYHRSKAYELVKEYFLKSFLLYGISTKTEAVIRDIQTAMDVLASVDMLATERKKGNSVADVLFC